MGDHFETSASVDHEEAQRWVTGRGRRLQGSRRLYSVETQSLREVDIWLERFRHMWDQPLDALDTEIARDKRERRRKK